MADFAIEQGMIGEEYRYDNPEEFEDENCDMPPNPNRVKTKYKVCRNCGVGGLHWQLSKESNGWRLYDIHNEIHNCNKKFAKGGKRIIYK